MAIRVILGEDSYIVREGLQQVLPGAPQVEVVAGCGDAGSLLREIEAQRLLESGSDGRAHLLKERIHDRRQLVRAIEAVATGQSVIDPKIVEVLVSAKARGECSSPSELTPALPRSTGVRRHPRCARPPAATASGGGVRRRRRAHCASPPPPPHAGDARPTIVVRFRDAPGCLPPRPHTGPPHCRARGRPGGFRLTLNLRRGAQT